MPRSASNKPVVTSLYDLTPPELESFFLSIGEKPYRAKQVLDFLYRHPIKTIDEMSTFSKSLRERLSGIVKLVPFNLRTTVESSDGSIKHAYEVDGTARRKILLESVWMPAEPTDIGPFGEGQKSGRENKGKRKHKRHTICISSQLGCAARCEFCATGSLGLHGQLTTGEIVYQVVHCKVLYGTQPDAVLLMGMGEPMHNFDAVSAAVEILTHPDALGLSPRRIVVSTVGELERLGSFHARFPKVRLAISLNAATNALRNKLMPVNERFDLKAISAFISSIDLPNGEKVTLEYVLLGDVNDTPSQIKALIRFLRPIATRVKVNLIPFNPVEGIRFISPDRNSVHAIQNEIRRTGINVFIRRNRGQNASAACGQLAGRT